MSVVHRAPRYHGVQLYERDAELVAGVVGFLRPALLGDEGVVIVATPEHRSAFAEALGDHDDVVSLDAAETMATFMVDGTPDPVLFRATIGPLVLGRRVRAYGEMVALLWDEGNVAAAMAVERLWNELAEEHDFSLLCGYHQSSFADDDDRRLLEGVCQVHTHVVDEGSEVTRHFDAGPRSAAAARRFVTETLRGWERLDLLDDAALVVSELATNAVLHAGAGFAVTVSRRGDAVRISVHDGSPGRPTPRRAGPEAGSGRGMWLVEVVARRWGTDPSSRTGGKTVWVDLG